GGDHRLDGHRVRRDRPVSTTEGPPVQRLDTFEFTPENVERARAHIAKYPPGREASAVLPLLDLAQRQMGGWVPRAAMDYVAGLLGMAPIRVYEVATSYTMFNLPPPGSVIGRHGSAPVGGKTTLTEVPVTAADARGSDDAR